MRLSSIPCTIWKSSPAVRVVRIACVTHVRDIKRHILGGMEPPPNTGLSNVVRLSPFIRNFPFIWHNDWFPYYNNPSRFRGVWPMELNQGGALCQSDSMKLKMPWLATDVRLSPREWLKSLSVRSTNCDIKYIVVPIHPIQKVKRSFLAPKTSSAQSDVFHKFISPVSPKWWNARKNAFTQFCN